MACDCKANEQIHKIYNKYGSKINPSFGDKINFRITNFIKTIILVLISLLFFPITILFFLIMFFLGKRKFNINNIINILLMKGKNE